MKNLANCSGKVIFPGQRPLVFAASSLFIIFTISCGSQEPETAEIADYLSSRLPGFLSLQDVECEFFPSKQEAGKGRASCRGRVQLVEDLFKHAQPYTVNSALEARGLALHQAQYLRERYPVQVIERTAEQGTATELRAEVRYQRIVDGWELDGWPLFQKFYGSPRDQLHEQAVAVGESRWNEYLARLTTRHEQLKRRSRDLQANINQFLKPASSLSGVHAPFFDTKVPYTLVPTEDLKWHEVDAYGKAYEKTFEALGKLLWREVPVGRGCGYSPPTQEEVVSISGRVYLSDVEADQSFRAELTVAFREGSGFMYCTSPSTWDGEKFLREEGRRGDSLVKASSPSD